MDASASQKLNLGQNPWSGKAFAATAAASSSASNSCGVFSTDTLGTEELLFLEEVLRIKEIIDKKEEQSEELLLDSLRQLQPIPMTVHILKETEIGKSVSALRKYGSREIRHLVRIIILDWRKVVDAWVDAQDHGEFKDSVENDRKPNSPPSGKSKVDSKAEVQQKSDQCAIQKLSCGDEASVEKKLEATNRKLQEHYTEVENGDDFAQDYEDIEAVPDEVWESLFLQDVLRVKEIIDNKEEQSEESLLDKLRQLQLTPMTVHILEETEIGKSVNALRKYGSREVHQLVRRIIEDWKMLVDDWLSAQNDGELKEKAESGIKPNGPPSGKSKVDNEAEVQQKSDPCTIQKLNCEDDKASVEKKLEATKRKLQQRYKEVENAKRQRTIKVVELRDLPKQKNQQRPPRKQNIRQRALRRR